MFSRSSIAILIQTGLFESAKQAKNKTENAQIEENTILGSYENKINEIVGSREEMKLPEEQYITLVEKMETLNYENKVDLTSTMFTVGVEYNVPKNGIIYYLIYKNDNSQETLYQCKQFWIWKSIHIFGYKLCNAFKWTSKSFKR